MTSSPDLRAFLVCPLCRGQLDWSATNCRCQACGHAFEIVEGIPLLLPDADAAQHEHRSHRNHHKGAQAAYYDEHEAAEFEIERPNHGPQLYEWLMREKFRRSIAGIDHASEKIALTVCGGSGMDAQFLAEAGFAVIASDISLGAVRRCAERARRFHLPITPVVADVEQLPFRDHAVPLVYVHDGLHHLEEPMRGLAEMARVAGSAISITEPASAAVTALAVRLGLALAYEAPGNRVARLHASQLRDRLHALGFDRVRTQRYAMYYRHEPGGVLRMLSRPRLLPIATGAARAVNAVAGRWGNKLAVNALRKAPPGGAATSNQTDDGRLVVPCREDVPAQLARHLRPAVQPAAGDRLRTDNQQ